MTASLELQQHTEVERSRLRAPLSRAVVPLLYLLAAAYCAIVSRGFVEADETSHFLFARSAWHDWTMILSIWGRLGCSVLYALVAPFGIVAARLLAVGITALVGIGTGILLRQMVRGIGTNRSWVARHGVAIAWMLLFAQPCFAMNAYTVMTEMLLALSWVWTAVALFGLRRKPWGVLLASFLLGLGGLARPEGWIAIACWPIFVTLWLRSGLVAGAGKGPLPWGRVLLATFLAGLPPLCWYVLGIVGMHDWLWVIPQWPWAPKSQYGARALQFFAGAVGSMGLWMWCPILIGMAAILRHAMAKRRGWPARKLAAVFVVIVPLAGLYLMHGILGGFGLFGSMALPRYFIAVAPMGAILAIMGLERIEQWLAGRSWGMLLRPAIIIAALLPIAGLVATGLVPTHPDRQDGELDVITEAIQSRLGKASGTSEALALYEGHLMLGHPYVVFRLGLPLWSECDKYIFKEGALEHAPAGMMLVTEPQLWLNEQHPSYDTLRAWGWRPDEETSKKVEQVSAQWSILQDMQLDTKTHSELWIKQ